MEKYCLHGEICAWEHGGYRSAKYGIYAVTVAVKIGGNVRILYCPDKNIVSPYLRDGKVWLHIAKKDQAKSLHLDHIIGANPEKLKGWE